MAALQNQYTLNSELTSWLEERRQVTPPKNGMRTISVSSYSPTSSPTDDFMTAFPEVANSEATLRLAGFSEDAAKEVFGKYEQLFKLFQHVELDNVAKEYVTGKGKLKDAYLPTHDYASAWKDMGMARARIEALVEDRHTTMRLTKSASEHFKDSISSTAAYVFGMAKAVGRKKDKSDLNASRAGSPALGVPPSFAKGRGRGKGAFDMGSLASNLPAPVVQTEVSIPTQVAGHTLLYKGGDLQELERIWYDDTSSKISLAKKTSLPPTDFHPADPNIFYTAKQLEVAEEYIAFKQILHGEHIVQGILYMAVPNDCAMRVNWIYDPDWSSLIWASRGPLVNSAFRKVPPELNTYVSGFGLAGNICGQPTEAVIRLNDKSQLQAMTLRNGNKAQQYAFFEDGIETLDEKCEGMIWLEERRVNSKGPVKSNGVARYRAKRSG